MVGSILNDVALQVNPAATGPFASAFARLSFAEKVYVFAAMDGTDPLKPLAGFLPAITGFLSYSQAGVLDPNTMTLAAKPVGWQLSGYEGVPRTGRVPWLPPRSAQGGGVEGVRDVVVVGAGGGGPVVAKELAARGLDVLLLEAGPRFADLEHEWTHFENDSTNPVTGILRFVPSDRTTPPWVRDRALVEQLGVELSTETAYLQQRILGGEPF